MEFYFEYYAHTLHTKASLASGQKETKIRPIIYIKITKETGVVCFGEIAPLPSHGSESYEEALAFCKKHSRIRYTFNSLLPFFKKLPACQVAIEYALSLKKDHLLPAMFPIAALLMEGDDARSVATLLSKGFNSFKLKIGTQSFVDEKKKVESILSYISPNQLRLDANGRLSYLEAIAWLDFLENHPVHFLEQPLHPGREDLMLHLSKMYRTPIAWDESLPTTQDLIKAIEKGFRGPWIMKPSLLGSLEDFYIFRAQQPDFPIVYSSCFESSLNISFILSLASLDKHVEPLGLGTLPFILPNSFIWHTFGPFIAYDPLSDYQRIQTLWSSHFL